LQPSVTGGLAFSSQLPPQRLFARILNGQQDTVGISSLLVSREDTLEFAIRGQLTLFEQRLHLARKLSLQNLRRKAAERAADVVNVPLEHRQCTVVARRIYRLR
jgi:hypothetical protein